MTVLSTPAQRSAAYAKEKERFAQKSFTFPSHYPSRIAAFLDYLELNGGCDESVAHQLIMEDEGELLVELTCWILDRINSTNSTELPCPDGDSTPTNPPTSLLSPSTAVRPVKDLQDHFNLVNSFGIGSRFRTAAVMEFLGINYGAIPVNKQYTAPVLALAHIRSSGDDIHANSVHFLWILRSRPSWSSSQEFRDAFNASPWLKFCEEIQDDVRSGTISLKHHPWSAPITRLWELVFYKTFPIVPGTNTPTPLNTHETTISSFSSFREDDLLLAFDRESTTNELLSWLGIHNDSLWFDIQGLAPLELALHGPYRSSVQRTLCYAMAITRQWDYQAYNYRVYDMCIQLFTTGYLYGKIPLSIRSQDLIMFYHQDRLYDQYVPVLDKNLDKLYENAINFNIDRASSPPNIYTDDFWGQMVSWITHPFYALRMACLSTMWNDAPVTAIGNYYLSETRADSLKKKLKREKKQLAALQLQLVEFKKNHDENFSTPIADEEGIVTPPVEDKEGIPPVVEDSTEQSPPLPQVIPYETQCELLSTEISTSEATIKLYSSQHSFYHKLAHSSLQLYEYYYSRCGFVISRLETVKALFCLAKSRDDDVLMARCLTTGLTESNFITFTYKDMVNYITLQGQFESNVLVPSTLIDSFKFNNDEFFYKKDQETGLSLHDRVIDLTRNGSDDSNHYNVMFNFTPYHIDALRLSFVSSMIDFDPWSDFIDGLGAVGEPGALQWAQKLLGGKTVSEMVDPENHRWSTLFRRPQFELSFLTAYVKWKPPQQWHPRANLGTRVNRSDDDGTAITIWDDICYTDFSDEDCVALYSVLWEQYTQTAHYQSTLPKATKKSTVGTSGSKLTTTATTTGSAAKTATEPVRSNVELITYSTLNYICDYALKITNLYPEYGLSRNKTLEWISKHLISNDVITTALPAYMNKLQQDPSNTPPMTFVTSQFGSRPLGYYRPSPSGLLPQEKWKNRQHIAATVKTVLKTLYPLKSHFKPVYLTTTGYLFQLVLYAQSVDVSQYVFTRIAPYIDVGHMDWIAQNVIGHAGKMIDHRDFVDFNSLMSMYHSEQLGLITSDDIKAGIKNSMKKVATVDNTDNPTNSQNNNSNDSADGNDTISDLTQASKSAGIIKSAGGKAPAAATSLHTNVAKNHLALSRLDTFIHTDNQSRRYLPHFSLPSAYITPGQAKNAQLSQNEYSSWQALPNRSLDALINVDHAVNFDLQTANNDNYSLFYEKYNEYYTNEIKKMSEPLKINIYGNVSTFIPSSFLTSSSSGSESALSSPHGSTKSTSLVTGTLVSRTPNVNVVDDGSDGNKNIDVGGEKTIHLTPTNPSAYLHDALYNYHSTDGTFYNWPLIGTIKQSDYDSLDIITHNNNLLYNTPIPSQVRSEPFITDIEPTNAIKLYNQLLPFTPSSCYTNISSSYPKKKSLPIIDQRTQYHKQTHTANQIERDITLFLPLWDLSHLQHHIMTEYSHNIYRSNVFSPDQCQNPIVYPELYTSLGANPQGITKLALPKHFYSKQSPFNPLAYNSLFDITSTAIEIHNGLGEHVDLSPKIIYPQFYRYNLDLFDQLFNSQLAPFAQSAIHPEPEHVKIIKARQTEGQNISIAYYPPPAVTDFIKFSKIISNAQISNSDPLHTTWDYFVQQSHSEVKYDTSSPYYQSIVALGLSPKKDALDTDLTYFDLSNETPDTLIIPVTSDRSHRSSPQPSSTATTRVQQQTLLPNIHIFGFLRWYIHTNSIPRMHKSTFLLNIAFILTQLCTSHDHLVTFINSIDEMIQEDLLWRIVPPFFHFLYDELLIGASHLLPQVQNTKLPTIQPSTSSTTVTYTPELLDINRIKQRYAALEKGTAVPGQVNSLGNSIDICSSSRCGMPIVGYSITSQSSWMNELISQRRAIQVLASTCTTFDYHLKSVERSDDKNDQKSEVLAEKKQEELNRANDSSQSQSKPESQLKSNPHRVYATPFECTYTFELSTPIIHAISTSFTRSSAREECPPQLITLSQSDRIHPFSPLCSNRNRDFTYSLTQRSHIQRAIPFLLILPFIPVSIIGRLLSYTSSTLSLLGNEPLPECVVTQLPLLINHATQTAIRQLQNGQESTLSNLDHNNSGLDVSSLSSTTATTTFGDSQNKISYSTSNSSNTVVDISKIAHTGSTSAVLDLWDIYLTKHKHFFLEQYKLTKKCVKNSSDSESTPKTLIDLNPKTHRRYLLELFTPYRQLSQLYQFAMKNCANKNNMTPINITNFLHNFHSFSLTNSHANYLWNRYLATVPQYPVFMNYNAYLPAYSRQHKPTSTSLVITAQQMLFRNTIQPNIISQIFNRDRSLSQQQRVFTTQWNDLQQRKRPFIFGPETLLQAHEHFTEFEQQAEQCYIDFGGKEGIEIDDMSENDNQETQNEPSNNQKISHNRHINPNHHITHFRHTPVLSNMTMLQVAENYKFEHIPHIPTLFTPPPIYTNGISLLIMRHHDVFSGAESDKDFGFDGDNNDGDDENDDLLLTPSQLIQYFQSNLTYDITTMNFINTHHHLGQMSFLTSDNIAMVQSHYEQNPLWLTLMKGVGATSLVGAVAYGLYQLYQSLQPPILTQSHEPQSSQ